MIFVERPEGNHAPASLTAPDGAGAIELDRARDFYRDNAEGTYAFAAYKSDDVKAELDRIFRGKCAYCESRYKKTAPMDVEHFRPKGRVENEAGHRGYWWLAASWSNLLPACIDCNRRRKHRVVTRGMTLEQLAAAGEVAVGKQDQFPIAGLRAFQESDDCTAESPLLIDPTVVEPSRHLAWYFDQDISVWSSPLILRTRDTP